MSAAYWISQELSASDVHGGGCSVCFANNMATTHVVAMLFALSYEGCLLGTDFRVKCTFMVLIEHPFFAKRTFS